MTMRRISNGPEVDDYFLLEIMSSINNEVVTFGLKVVEPGTSYRPEVFVR